MEEYFNFSSLGLSNSFPFVTFYLQTKHSMSLKLFAIEWANNYNSLEINGFLFTCILCIHVDIL